MKKIIGVVLGTAFFMHTAWAAEGDAAIIASSGQEAEVRTQAAADELHNQDSAAGLQAAVPKATAIVMLGSERYLQADYQDILARYFVKCYSKYRFPTAYGRAAQDDFRQVYDAVGAGRDIQRWTPEQVAEILDSMDKEQILFLNVHDRVYRQRRCMGWHMRDDAWGAVVFVKAMLVDKDGIVTHKEFQYQADEQHTPGGALQEAYTQCVRQLQKADLFAAK